MARPGHPSDVEERRQANRGEREQSKYELHS
jgi:hypothetical protein